jgi:hypothetical protein
MSESQHHIDLVNVTLSYVRVIVPKGMESLIEVDNTIMVRPKKLSGDFIPDVFFWNNDLMIIGEAKTLNDFDRKHSQEQFCAYIEECNSFYGRAVLVIAVPWQLVAKAKNHFKILKTQMECKSKVVILNELGRLYEL